MDSAGNGYITGYTNGERFPLANPVQPQLTESFCTTFSSQRLCFDAFAVKLTPSGTLTYGTYLGGSFDDFAYDLAVHSGSLYVTGMTEADNFPTTSNAFQPNKISHDAFLVTVAEGESEPPPPQSPDDNWLFVPMIFR